MARAITVEDLHPRKSGAFLVVLVDPKSARDRPLAKLGDEGYERDGALYVTTTSVWFERCQDQLRIWRAGPDTGRTLLFEASVVGTLLETGPTLLIVDAADSVSIDTALAPIRSGEQWPVVLGPSNTREPTLLAMPGHGVLALDFFPEDERVWRGAFHYRTEGDEHRSVFYFVTPRAAPTPEELGFARTVLDNVDAHVARAYRAVRAAVLEAPSDFGIATTEADGLASLPDSELPFRSPELTFYSDKEWLMRFAESDLLACQPYGVSVEFVGDLPKTVEVLSGEPYADLDGTPATD